MIWYHNLPPNSINSFAMLADAFVKAHAGNINVKTRKSDPFKGKQRDNEMLREFVSRFQMKWMDMPPVADDWVVQAFTQGINPQISLASQQLKQNFIEYPAVTWADIHNGYQSKIRVEDDQLGVPYGFVYPIRTNDKSKRVVDHEPRPNRDRPLRAMEVPRLSECNFNVNVASIVSAIGRIKETKCAQSLQSDPAQIDPNLMCTYHGTYGHMTEDCQPLREEVSRLFNSRHLQEFLRDRAKNHFRNRDSNKQTEQKELQHVINMIIGGVDVP
nr:uncharacterized protein LOC104102405 [Nicotiana tomentosiformis]